MGLAARVARSGLRWVIGKERGVMFRATAAASVLLRNLMIYGLGGILVPFIGIKLIDLLVKAIGLV